MTAVFPAVSDTEYPAPTTWATSWIVAPSIIPVICASKPSQVQNGGYTTIAKVERAFTATTTKTISVSLPL